MRPENWRPLAEWEALVRGDNCPLCAAVVTEAADDEYGTTVADLAFSRLRLVRNQFVRGYCVLISHRHVREPYELNDAERHLFFDDMMRVGRALERVFQPLKMNFELLGNAIPHLHAHILPRYYGDPAPHRPIHPDAEMVYLTAEEMACRAQLIREALGFVDAAIPPSFLDDEGRVTAWPGQKKRAVQQAILRYLASKFEFGRVYSEREVNELLKRYHTFEDWAMLRREMFENGLLNREKDGSSYWRPNQTKLY